MRRAAVIGAGSWGTAFAGVVASNVDSVIMWAHSASTVESINTLHKNDRYLTDYDLPANISATSSYEEACKDAELIVMALPSTHLRRVSHEISSFVAPDAKVLVLTKGIEAKTSLLMTDVVSEELGGPSRVCALTGPNHAEEVCRGQYAAAVCAENDIECAKAIQDAVCTREFRVYVSDDELGLEICGATKNVIAIACGIVAGAGMGDNTLAIIMTRGIAEIGRLVAAAGGDPMTCMGLAGMGDLVATCTSPHSRNRSFGEAFAKGTTLEEYENKTHMVVEGARACISVRELAHKHGVEVPITEAVYNLLYENMPFEEVSQMLAGREPKVEFYGFNQGEEGIANA